MRFANPQMLWLLLAVPVLAALFAWSIGRRRKALERYAAPAALLRFGVDVTSWKHWVRPLLALLATAAVIVATARPQWGHEDRRIVSRGIDLMIAVDTSNSMLAQDYQPNRLERAKTLLQNILWELKGDRVGIMAFAGNAVVLCPLTLDYGMANTALKAVDPNTVSTQGTALGVAIESATKAFEAAGAGERVLILLTDGEDQGTDLASAAKKAADAGIKIFAIGIGDAAGTPIPLGGGFKQDKQGKMVQSKLNFEALKEIASVTKGNAIKANLTGASEVAAIASELKALHGASHQDRVYRVYKDRYAWFLAPAIVLLILEALGLGAPRRRRTRLSSIVPARAAAGLLLVLSWNSHVFAYLGEDRVLSEKALLEYQKGEYEKAAELYQKAAEKQNENAVSRFNLGAAKYKAGDTKTARETLNSVFDAQSPLLNAAAQYNMGVIDHQGLRKQIQDKTGGWQKTVGQGDEKVMGEIKDYIKKLEGVAGQYKGAILNAPDDREMKANYEIARRELDQLKEQLKQQQTPEQQKQEQQEQEKKEDEKKDQQQGDKGQDKEQEQKNPEQDQQKNEQQKDEQQKEQDKKDEAKKEQDKKDEQKKPDRAGDEPQKPDDKPGDDKQPKPEENKDGEEKKEEPKEDKEPPAATPTPAPAATPTPGPGEQPKPGEEQKDGKPPEEVPVGEMSKTDVERLLNSLPPQNDQALQRFYNQNHKMRPDMEKDW